MDFALTKNGDIFKSGAGVIQLSLVDNIGQRVDHILRSKPGDWARKAGMGAYLPKYVGYPNLPSTKAIIEDEITEALNRDRLVGSFPITVEYTPTALDTAMVEITIQLPDGNAVSIYRELNPAGTINTIDGLPYTPPSYDTETLITKTEVITLTEASNVFEISQIPINDNVFITEYNDSLELLDDGTVEFQASGIIHSYEYISGLSPSGMLTPRTFELPIHIQDVLQNRMIQSIEITADDTILTTNDYQLDSKKLTLRQTWSETVDGVLVYHGVEQAPSGIVTIDVDYFYTYPILSMDSYEQDSIPQNVFPRTRIISKNFVTLKQSLAPGNYFVQYSTYALEV